eukprot:gene49-2013_t
MPSAEICFDGAAGGTGGTDRRRLFLALPQGTPPQGGWPIYLDFAAIMWPKLNGSTCGESDQYAGP